MRRADRLFQMILEIGNAQVITGKQLAQSLGVTIRTIYRDIGDLTASGVPIEGEAGVGYRLRRGYQVPPMMFTDEELQALHLGVSIVRTWSDAKLAAAARQALAKVEAVLPIAARPRAAHVNIIVPTGHVPVAIADNLSLLREAIRSRRKVSFDYPRPFSEKAERLVRPLVLIYWGGAWTLGSWCQNANDFRTFRLDVISKLRMQNGVFGDEQGRQVDEYLKALPTHDAVLGAVVDALQAAEKPWPTVELARNKAGI